MWLALANKVGEGDEQLVRDLEAIAHFAEELRARLSSTGLDGLEGALVAHTRIQSVLEALSSDELEEMRARIATLRGALGEVAERLERLRRAKQVLAR